MDDDDTRVAALVIANKSQLYAGVYLLCLIACVLIYVTPSWFGYIASTLVLLCVGCAYAIRGLFNALHAIHSAYGYRDRVLSNHLRMNAASFVLLAYAWLAVIRDWPAPWLAVLCAFVLNFMHYYGYSPQVRRDRR